MTELDKKLQELALKDWDQFVILIGQDSIVSAKICILRKGDKSYGEIVNRLGVSYKQARTACNKCGAK
jgi:hypothetical protein